MYNELINNDSNVQLPIVINEFNIIEIKNNIVNIFIPYFISKFSINNLKANYPNLYFPNTVLAWINAQDFIDYLNKN